MTLVSALDAEAIRFIAQARRATLATTDPEGRPRLVPICFVAVESLDEHGRLVLYTSLDEKPKRVVDPRRLARVQDLLVLPEATLLVDRWDEDWSRLGWVRLRGTAELLEPQPREREEHAAAIAALRAKYRQYRDQRIEKRPILRIRCSEAVAWGNLAPLARGRRRERTAGG